MSKAKKIFICVGAVLFILILALGIWFMLQGRTVDCRGTVESITVFDDGSAVITVKGVFDGPTYTLRVIPGTSMTTDSGDKLSLQDISVGDTISANYRGKYKNADTVLDAKWIKVTQKSR